jgi:hypothetical protein
VEECSNQSKERCPTFDTEEQEDEVVEWPQALPEIYDKEHRMHKNAATASRESMFCMTPSKNTRDGCRRHVLNIDSPGVI